MKSCLNYMISYVTDRPGGFIESEIADLTRVSQRLPVVADITASGRSPAMCSTPIWARRPVRGWAIFPIDAGNRCRRCTPRARCGGRGAPPVRRLGDDPAMAGEPPLNVVALHAGTVIYGNIGAADRSISPSSARP